MEYLEAHVAMVVLCGTQQSHRSESFITSTVTSRTLISPYSSIGRGIKTDGFDDEVDVNVTNYVSSSSQPIKITLNPQ